MDDKSAVEAPFRYREGTAPDPKTSMSVNGITCYTSERFTACAMGSSATFHDSDVIIQQLLLDIFTEVNGHMAAVFVWDQGPLNYNAAVALALPLFLVQLGFFTLAIPIFLQLFKSKAPTDRNFGVMETAIAKGIVLGKAHLSYLVEQLVCNTSTAEHMRFLTLNPYAINLLKEHVFAKRFNLNSRGALPSSALFKEKQYHIFVASGEGAAEYAKKSPLVDVFVDEPPLSIEGLAARLIGAPGWVTATHLPSSPRVDGFYMLRQDPEYNTDSPPKFGLGVSTVRQRKAAKAAEAAGSQKRAKIAPSTQNTQEGVDLPSKSDVEMVDGVKENETALQAFGYQAYRKRFGEWQHAIEAVTSSGFTPYPEGYTENQCTNMAWIQVTGQDLRKVNLPPVSHAIALGLEPDMIGVFDNPLVLQEHKGQSFYQDISQYSKSVKEENENDPLFRCTVIGALDYITKENESTVSRRDDPGAYWRWNEHMQRAHNSLTNLTREQLGIPDKAKEAKSLFKTDLLKVVFLK